MTSTSRCISPSPMPASLLVEFMSALFLMYAQLCCWVSGQPLLAWRDDRTGACGLGGGRGGSGTSTPSKSISLSTPGRRLSDPGVGGVVRVLGEGGRLRDHPFVHGQRLEDHLELLPVLGPPQPKRPPTA